MLQGVRLVGFQDHMLTLGTGSGSIRLWDLRTARFLRTDAAVLPLAELEPSRALLAVAEDGATALSEEAPASAAAAGPVMGLVLQSGFLDRCRLVSHRELCLNPTLRSFRLSANLLCGAC